MECGLQIPDPLPMNLIYTMVRVPTNHQISSGNDFNFSDEIRFLLL